MEAWSLSISGPAAREAGESVIPDPVMLSDEDPVFSSPPVVLPGYSPRFFFSRFFWAVASMSLMRFN